MKTITLMLLTIAIFLSSITISCEGIAPKPDKIEREEYAVCPYARPCKVMELRTIERWEGEGVKEIKFKAEKSPWVVNANYYEVTSQIASHFYLLISRKVDGFEKSFTTFTSETGIQTVLIEETGDFNIRINASGCKWWVKIGIE